MLRGLPGEIDSADNTLPGLFRGDGRVHQGRVLVTVHRRLQHPEVSHLRLRQVPARAGGGWQSVGGDGRVWVLLSRRSVWLRWLLSLLRDEIPPVKYQFGPSVVSFPLSLFLSSLRQHKDTPLLSATATL